MYDFLIGTSKRSFNKIFAHEQISSKKDGETIIQNKNIFLVKQDYFGNREWEVDLGLSDQESGNSATFDSTENIYLTRYKRNRLESIDYLYNALYYKVRLLHLRFLLQYECQHNL